MGAGAKSGALPVHTPGARHIRQAMGAAVRSIESFKAWQPALPATLELKLYRSDMADELASQVGVERLDARMLRRRIESF